MIRTAAMLLCLAAAVSGATLPEFGPSIGYAKGDPALTVAGLRGKAVLVLFGQSWCGICNGWTPTLLSQIEANHGGKSGVVLLLVKTDGDAASGRAYLAERKVDPERWFVVGDDGAAWTKAVMGEDTLWQYAVVDPAGSVVERGKAGMFSKGKDGGQVFSLARSKALEGAAKTATSLLPAGTVVPPGAARAAQLAEVGCFAEAFAALAGAPKADADAFRGALLAGASTRVGALAATLAGEAPDRFAAYLALRDLAAAMKGSEPAKQAEAAMKEAAKLKPIQRELAAEKAWKGALARIESMPVSKREAATAQARADFAKAYADTWFAGTVGR